MPIFVERASDWIIAKQTIGNKRHSGTRGALEKHDFVSGLTRTLDLDTIGRSIDRSIAFRGRDRRSVNTSAIGDSMNATWWTKKRGDGGGAG